MVKVNNKEMKWQKGMTLINAIEFADYPEYNYPILVITLNGDYIKNHSFEITEIKKGDEVRIIQALDGG